MPLYPYRCTDCGHQEDRFMSLADYDKHGKGQQCAVCEGRMKQLIVPVNLGMTDDEFMSGPDCPPAARQKAVAMAKRCGISTTGKKFIPELNEWVSDRHDVLRICKERGLECDGAVKCKGVVFDQPAPDEVPYRISPKIIEQEIRAKERKENEGRRFPKGKRELLRHELTKLHTGNQL